MATILQIEPYLNGETPDKEVLTIYQGEKTESKFEKLLSQANEIQSKCKDYAVTKANLESARFNAESGMLSYIPDEGVKKQSPLSKYALGQLCTRLSIPVRYVDNCVKSGRTDLATENINSWLEDFNKDLFIREYNGSVRGILSSKYKSLDTPDILNTLYDVIDIEDYDIKGYHLSPERFHARIVQKEMLNIDGEDLYAGIQIDSSDVGRSTLVVRFMIFKQICTNGLCITKGGGILFEQRHVGIDLDDFRETFKEAMTRIPILIANAEELIKESMQHSSRYAVDKFSTEKLNEFYEKVKNKTQLSNEAMDKVIDLMNTNYSNTKWGLINSITEVAQEYTLERRIELEKIAGDMLFEVA